ncbi:hypothetical protein ATANTOWER_030359 [Ataeniobius toweri]|uniref:Uncharacterized protein n=1 Tax=Ataeniobius toweri TaxID=208326 RepID=A0ABU7ABW1_9TELE|nr:hypothetical protein [Ataeniobius toweri]
MDDPAHATRLQHQGRWWTSHAYSSGFLLEGFQASSSQRRYQITWLKTSLNNTPTDLRLHNRHGLCFSNSCPPSVEPIMETKHSTRTCSDPAYLPLALITPPL